MADPAPAASGGLFGTLYNLIGSAAATVNSYLGWEDLEVVEPDGESADTGAKASADGAGLNTDERKQAWGTQQFQQYIGMDVTSLLSVPVWIMEPFSILQKAAEIMEYADLLDRANETTDEFERFAYVAAFCVSPFGALERAWKPFNPILGETFEVESATGARYLAEQVSHHPPVCAAHAENDNFTYDIVSAPTTRFLGNSLEVFPLGRTRVTLRTTGETYSLVPPNAMVHNIVIGRTWVDAQGQMRIHCPTNGSKCLIDFTPCGWFSMGRYNVNGWVYDKAGVKRVLISGKWNTGVDMVACSPDGEALAGAVSTRMWTCNPKPANDYYSFTAYAHKLNSCGGIPTPMASDSRRRADRSALYASDSTKAGLEKYRLEEQQRAERKERDKRGGAWTARWFEPVAAPELIEGELDAEKVPFWQFNGQYRSVERAPIGSADEIDGKGFNPWQYPELLLQ